MITNLEVNFGVGNNVEKQKEKQRKMISQIDARMRSRFLRGTYLPTLNIIISSKDTEQAFLNSYINLKKQNESKTSLIIDEPQWVVDSRKGSPDDPGAFYVAIGNKFLAHELLPPNTDEALVDKYREKGYTMLKVPPGYRETFEDNLDQALMDIAGFSTSSATKYISGVRLNQAKTEDYRNPFTKDIIEVGNAPDDHLQYANFFDMSRVSPSDISRPLFIHLDMSMSGDKTGIAGVWITGKTPSIDGDDSSRTLRYKLAFSVSIKAPKGYQVSFEKNRNFIKWLRDRGFAIKGISSDTFQSATILQELKSDGFNTVVQSVDRVDNQTRICIPYDYLKSAIYERHLTIYYKCDLLTDELVGLERKGDGHIDHTPEGINCLTGDTKVSLVDGRELTMLDLVNEYEAGKQNYVYTVNEKTLAVEPKLIKKAYKSGTVGKLLRITLDNGETITCTPEHRFMLRNGVYCQAQHLLIGDSLMPLYRKYPDKDCPMHDYRLIYCPDLDRWKYEHRLFATDVLDEKRLVHHKNCNKSDNSPTNLIWCSKAAHMNIHAALQTGAQSNEAKLKRRQSLVEYHANNKNTTSYILAHNRNLTESELDEFLLTRQKQLEEKHARIELINSNFGIDYETLPTAEKLKFNNYLYNIEHNYCIGAKKLAIDKHEQLIKDISNEFNVDAAELSKNELQSYAIKLNYKLHPETRLAINNAIKKNHELSKYDNAHKALQSSNNRSKELKKLFPVIDDEKFIEFFGFSYSTVDHAHAGVWTNRYRKKMYDVYNHAVVNIEVVDDIQDVYDLTIEDNPNFALSAGIFVHNSKDQADAVCGALFLASKFSEEYGYSYGENIEALIDANDLTESDRKIQLLTDFQSELAKIYQEEEEVITEERRAQQSDYESYRDILDGIIVI